MSKSLPFTSWKDENGDVPVEITMVGILATICAVIFGMILFQSPVKDKKESRFFPAVTNAAKLEFEQFALVYTVVWIMLFGAVVATGAYEHFTENSYMQLCTALASPFLLQPILFPMKSEKHLPLFERYSFKANVWIAIFSFIGNYWYTHYFYSVLQARYTFPAHRLNDVPIALFFATHFYFVTYHTFSNMLLRKVETSFNAGLARSVLFWTVIFAFAYFTAFMESLSISAFPYYSFKDKYMAYTVGSAFYGIYFIVSYPVFYSLDEKVNSKDKSKSATPHSLYQTVMEALGASMLVLCLLDFCRIAYDIPLKIPGKAYYIYRPPKN
jgi:cycloeucalenol cycloisomerase